MGTKANVALIRGKDRRACAFESLHRVREDVEPRLHEDVLLKPNFLSDSVQLASSHADTVRGVLDFLLSSDTPPRRVLITEGSAGSTTDAFQRFGYAELTDEYDVDIELFDLHQETRWRETTIFTAGDRVRTVRMPRTILDSPCTFSLARAKTHDVCVVTLSLKNMIMGTIAQPDRVLMHGFPSHPERRQPVEAKYLNVNLIRLARYLAPDVSVVDGVTGLQGNGPGGTNQADLDVVAAGIDVFAVDAVMTEVMGFAPELMGTLHYARKYRLGCTRPEQINVLGVPVADVATRFQPHESTQKQLQWQKHNADALLAAA